MMRGPKLDESVIEYLLDERPSRSHDKFFSQEKLKNTFALQSFPLPPEQMEVLKSLLARKDGVNILFHGKAGCGKTSLAKSLVKFAGKELYSIPSKEDYGSKSRVLGLNAARHALDPKQSVILVDEADGILNTSMGFFLRGESLDKGWVNQFLDERKGQFIWISNEVENIPTSTLRRFDTHIELPPLTDSQKTEMWTSLARRNKVRKLNRGSFTTLAKKYEATPSVIQTVLGVVGPISRKKNGSSRKVLRIINQQMGSATKLLDITVNRNSIEDQCYSINYLNTDLKVGELETNLKEFVQRMDSDDVKRGVSLLFEGPPGTGKTELARHLARALERRLIVKRASDILSKWVGGSEKNIASAFREAEAQGAILFFDEFDSFLRGREMADHSWEVTQVNEMLTQMESFRGIFMASTNFSKFLDPACLRRFTFKIRFGYVAESMRREVFQNIFSWTPDVLNSAQTRRLRSISKLALGDFGVVANKVQYLNVKTNDEVLDLLEQEVKAKTQFDGRPIGIRA